MKPSLERAHLRLVPASDKAAEAAAATGAGSGERQLSLPYLDTSSVFLVNVSSLRTSDFSSMLERLCPRWVFDVRAVPRFDTLASSRASAFALFDKTKSHYVDVFGRLGIKSYRSVESNPIYWSDTIVGILKTQSRSGPYFFLFDDEPLLRTSDNILPSVMEGTVGRPVHFETVGQTAAL